MTKMDFQKSSHRRTPDIKRKQIKDNLSHFLSLVICLAIMQILYRSLFCEQQMGVRVRFNDCSCLVGVGWQNLSKSK